MAIKSKGTLISYGNMPDHTSSTTWTPLVRVKSIKPGMRKVPAIETTVLSSNAKEQIPGLPECDDYEAVVEYSADQSDHLDDLIGVMKGWKITYTDNSTRKFTAWISESGEESVENGGIVTQSIKISVTGLDEYDDGVA